MTTPKYTALVDKLRDWSNRPENATISDTVLGDCLSYAADECYRTLRIPPLEQSVTYTVSAEDNEGESSMGLPYGNAWTVIPVPEDLTEFVYIRTLAGQAGSTPYAQYPSNASIVFNEVADARTFLDIHSERYSLYNFMWKGNKIYIHPQLGIGQQLEIHYYRRLPALDAAYAVIPVNYIIGLSDALQPYLSLTGVITDTPLYFSTSLGVTQAFATLAEAQAYDPTVTTKYYIGLEAPNWLKDENERLLVFGSLAHLGAYLFDDKMEQRYKGKFEELMFSINKEEKFRRARGGNVQMNFNSRGMF